MYPRSKVKDKRDSVSYISIDDASWKNIFKVCFSFTYDTSLTWIKYRILNRIIGARKYLVIINKDNSSKCHLYSEAEESIENLFCYGCNTSQLWDDFFELG